MPPAPKGGGGIKTFDKKNFEFSPKWLFIEEYHNKSGMEEHGKLSSTRIRASVQKLASPEYSVLPEGRNLQDLTIHKLLQNNTNNENPSAAEPAVWGWTHLDLYEIGGVPVSTIGAMSPRIPHNDLGALWLPVYIHRLLSLQERKNQMSECFNSEGYLQGA